MSGLLPPIEPSRSAYDPSSPVHHDPADERPLPTLINKKSVNTTLLYRTVQSPYWYYVDHTYIHQHGIVVIFGVVYMVQYHHLHMCIYMKSN